MKRLIIHPLADAEIEEAAAFYDSRRTGLGRDFVGEIQAAFDQISRQPEAYPVMQRGTRAKLLARFPYSLLFRIEGDTLRIYAAMHQHRRPGYWLGRVPRP
jgi:plasmid stabilization system protein ParE